MESDYTGQYLKAFPRVTGGVLSSEVLSTLATGVAMVGARNVTKDSLKSVDAFVAKNIVQPNIGFFNWLDEVFPAIMPKADDWNQIDEKEKARRYANTTNDLAMGFSTGFAARALTQSAIDRHIFKVPQKNNTAYYKSLAFVDVPVQVGAMLFLQKLAPKWTNEAIDNVSEWLQNAGMKHDAANNFANYLVNFQGPNGLGAIARTFKLTGNLAKI